MIKLRGSGNTTKFKALHLGKRQVGENEVGTSSRKIRHGLHESHQNTFHACMKLSKN